MCAVLCRRHCDTVPVPLCDGDVWNRDSGISDLDGGVPNRNRVKNAPQVGGSGSSVWSAGLRNRGIAAGG